MPLAGGKFVESAFRNLSISAAKRGCASGTEQLPKTIRQINTIAFLIGVLKVRILNMFAFFITSNVLISGEHIPDIRAIRGLLIDKKITAASLQSPQIRPQNAYSIAQKC